MACYYAKPVPVASNQFRFERRPRFGFAAQNFLLKTPVPTSALDADHSSARVEADLMSTTGVPSNTSIGPILTRVPSISRTVTGCSPSGFGRAGERV